MPVATQQKAKKTLAFTKDVKNQLDRLITPGHLERLRNCRRGHGKKLKISENCILLKQN